MYAVWFNMYPGDARAKWPASLLTDTRVTHFWDEQRAVGKMYVVQLPSILDRRAPETMPPTADTMWDAFFTYRPGQQWNDAPPRPQSWGYPIMVTHLQLASDVDALAKR